MNLSLKQVEAVVKMSAIFRRSWRSNKTLSELNAGLGGESFNPPQAILHNVDMDESSIMDESSMLADETCNPPGCELVAKLRAERINRPQIAFSNQDEDASFVSMDESSMVANETYVSSWREQVSKLRAEKINRPQILFSNEDEDEGSFMGMDEGSVAADETYISSWSEEVSKLRAEKINRPKIILSDDDEDEDSFMGMGEGSMAADESGISSWSEEVAKLRAQKINRPKIVLSDDDEGENSIVSIDESAMVVDEAHTSSSSAVDDAHVPSSSVDESDIISSSSVSEKYSKFKRPSSVRFTDVKGNANRVSLIGSICNRVKFKCTSSGQRLVWTSIHMRDENFCISGILQLFFLSELADIARQHLKIGNFVYVFGELVQLEYKIWIKAEELKFVQRPVTRNTETLAPAWRKGLPS